MGAIQQSLGDDFEKLFSDTCRFTRGFAITRFPSACKVVRGGELVQIKAPWDWVVSYKGKTALIDTKTTEGDTFPHSKITSHQVEELYAHSIAGATATGYVIWFRKSDGVYFASSLILNNLLNVRGSLKTDMLQFLGKSGAFKPQIMFGMSS